MELGTDFITPNKRISDNDFRASHRASVDENDTGGGWTWVAALLVAGLFIVSGYLDQESASAQTQLSESSASPSYVASPPGGATMVAGQAYQAEKGY